MVFLEAHTFNRPEFFVGSAQTKFDDKGELEDQATADFIKQHLAGFEAYIRKVSGK
jgi:chromate reductase, NAD(P)H dehydrogenase (quinone)